MKQPESKKDTASNVNQPKPTHAKPKPIENWENEGGRVIPTGPLPKVVFPERKENKEASD